ncbi:MAG: hypothetical protein FH749_10910 [Firmicutes bacterium]|nr:hypothetical protein [Bacillota bacterium]
MRRTGVRVRNICWQSTLRQRGRTLFLLFLVGLISFAFIARAVEYLVVDREIDRLAGYFRTIGYLEGAGQWDDLSEGAELVAESQYVALEDRRRHCSGVLQGLYNAHVGGGPDMSLFNNIVVAYGELRSKSQISTESTEPTGYILTFQVDQVLAGYPEHIREGSRIQVDWLSEDYGDGLETAYASLEVGERYLLTAWYRSELSHEPSNLVLRPLNDNGLWLLPVVPGTDAAFSDPALVGLGEEITAIRENQRALHVIGTKDMGVMPAVQESAREFYLTQGRWLDRTDDIEGCRVAVVHQDFAELRGLALGDSLTLELRNLKEPIYGYIIPGQDDWGLWQDYETYTEEFEIVGVFGSSTGGYNLFMYIPDSCLPAEYDAWHWNRAIYYSFVLSSPWDIEAFQAENEEALIELGMRSTFLDAGDWENFYASVGPIKRSAAMSAGIFALVLVLALILAAFIYLRQQRRNFAILRSLGVPKFVAVRQMLQPMALVGAAGILVGGITAWLYALGQAADTLASLQVPRGIDPSTALSPLWLVGLSAGALALLLLFTHAGTVLTAHRPVLELLQDVAGRAAARRKTVADAGDVGKLPATEGQESLPALPTVSFSLGQVPAGATKLGLAQGARYVLRHIRRARLKSALTVAVALCFTLALGWMSWTMERNEAELDRLYRTTQVEAAIVKAQASSPSLGGFIGERTVNAILRSGFVESAYLEGGSIARQASFMGEGWDSERTETMIALRAFDQPEQFFVKSGSNISVEYADGWDEGLFARDWPEEEASPVLMPASLLARLGLHPGEEVMISFKGTMDSYIIAGWYMGSVKGDASEPILLPLSVLRQVEEGGLFYSVAEFVLDPAKNRELPEFRAQMHADFSAGAGTVPLHYLLWDGELANVVEPLEKNLQLMAVLFPVTMAVSVLIAAGLAVLLIFQATKAAALLRILGTTKARARAMLCWEQVALCMVGLILGLAALVILRQDVSGVLMGPAMLSAGFYLAGSLAGALFSAISVTNRMPLELLQVKE